MKRVYRVDQSKVHKPCQVLLQSHYYCLFSLIIDNETFSQKRLGGFLTFSFS